MEAVKHFTFDHFNDLLYSQKAFKDNGLVEGGVGLVLCNAYYYSITEKEHYLDRCDHFLQQCVGTKNNDFSLGYGIAGTAWGIDRLVKMGVMEKHPEWISRVDRILVEAAEGMLEKEIINYFYGVTGILNYLLDREGEVDCGKLCRRLIRILDTNFETLPFLRFDPKFKAGGELFLNLGMPHGVTGIIAILLKMQEKGIVDTHEMTHRFFDLLMRYRVEGECYFFPTYELPVNRSSLAWCYGDLPVCYFLNKYRLLFRDNTYQELTQQILENCLIREDYFTGNVALCHGAIVVAYLFHKLERFTEDERCRERADYWLKLSEKLFEDMANQYDQTGEYRHFFENPALITGFSGYYLARMVLRGQINDEGWDSSLLLQ